MQAQAPARVIRPLSKPQPSSGKTRGPAARSAVPTCPRPPAAIWIDRCAVVRVTRREISPATATAASVTPNWGRKRRNASPAGMVPRETVPGADAPIGELNRVNSTAPAAAVKDTTAPSAWTRTIGRHPALTIATPRAHQPAKSGLINGSGSAYWAGGTVKPATGATGSAGSAGSDMCAPEDRRSSNTVAVRGRSGDQGRCLPGTPGRALQIVPGGRDPAHRVDELVGRQGVRPPEEPLHRPVP